VKTLPKTMSTVRKQIICLLFYLLIHVDQTYLNILIFSTLI